MSTINRIENGKVEIKIELTNDAWKEAQEKALNKLIKKVEVKGFRKGQAPLNLAKKAISPQQILMDAMYDNVEKLYIDAINKHDLDVIAAPELKVEGIDENALKIAFVVEVAPEISLNKYTDLGYVENDVTVSDEEVAESVNKELERRANLELKEGAVENGDTTVIDFEGFKDGVAFEGGKGENYTLVIGSGSFIPGFEEQLIGMKEGEEKDITVTFPENYHSEELKGKEVVFKIKLHEVKVKVLPELNDEFVKELKIDGVETVDSYKENLKNRLLESKKSEEKNNAENKLFETLVKENDFEVPVKMIENESNDIYKEFEQRLMYQGMKIENYLKYTNSTKEQLLESYKDEATRRVKLRTILKAIIKKENLSSNDEEVENEINNLSNQYKMPVEELIKYINKDDLKNELTFKKAIELIKK